MSASSSGARMPAAERRTQLLDVARDLFGTKGYASTSMNDIADSAGITKPVVYQHFDSKRELYLELIREAGRLLEAAIAEGAATADGPRDMVAKGFHGYFAHLDQQPSTFLLLYGDGVRADPEFAAETKRVEISINALIASTIEVETLPQDDRRLLAHALAGMAESVARNWFESDRTRPATAVANQLASFAWSGLRSL